jgi:hypothetical protein
MNSWWPDGPVCFFWCFQWKEILQLWIRILLATRQFQLANIPDLQLSHCAQASTTCFNKEGD